MPALNIEIVEREGDQGEHAQQSEPPATSEEERLEREVQAELKDMVRGKRPSPIVRRGQTTKQFLDDSKRAKEVGLGV